MIGSSDICAKRQNTCLLKAVNWITVIEMICRSKIVKKLESRIYNYQVFYKAQTSLMWGLQRTDHLLLSNFKFSKLSEAVLEVFYS